MVEKKFKFNILAFFVAFVLGMIYVYISAPKPKIIIKYPTPFNVNKLVYKSDNDICYKYDVEEIKCNKDAIDQKII